MLWFQDMIEIMKDYIQYVVRCQEAKAAWAKALGLIVHNLSYSLAILILAPSSTEVNGAARMNKTYE